MNPASPADPYPQGAPRAPEDEDAVLLRRMAAGDESALGALYDRWAPLVHSVVLRIAGDPDDAEELVEETFWQAWRQAGRYQPARGGTATWLVVMARSRALDRVRLAGHRRAAGHEALEAVDAAGPAAPEAADAAELDETRRIVRAAVEALPPEQRETVELAYFGGMSQTEIAAATGQPLGTVKTRIRLALGKLRDALSQLRDDGP